MANSEEKPVSDKKIVDVAKPGQSKPDATARPVIVGHGAMVTEDPMVNASKPAESVTETGETKLSTNANKVIEPPKDMDSKEKTTDSSTDPEKPAEKVPEDEPPKDTEAEDSAVVDAVAEQADKNKKSDQSAEKNEEELAKIAAIQKTIEDKKYFVSISATRGQRSFKRVLWIFLILILLGLVGTYLLIDAGIVKTSIQLPFDLIKSQS